MLLFDLIYDDVLASSFSDFVIDDCAGDGGEEEHVEEDEDNIEDVVWLVILYC